ncbi:uncharacterized protein LOC105194806 [Solenopsis invicta]|uniref:uncharacterized protein LOC105194806 n=1 Tax=Solenopsis invicta TaxID=13686 RepID=UPI00193EAB94|nr:uncharacterized protein LOC105194806 [Solenopsis invicta]
MEPVEFVAVEEDTIDDLRIENNCLPFDPFEVEERKQELTDALKYCIDLLKDAQIISDLQNSNKTISKRSQLMGKEIQRRIMDMLYFMKFTEDKEDEVVVCQENSISYSLENSCDSNRKKLKNNIKSVEKDASILNQSFECVDKDQSNGLLNDKNSIKTRNTKNGTSNKIPRQRTSKTSQKEERMSWDAAMMIQAINCVKSKTLGYTRAANLFEVPRTTLRRLVARELSSKECVDTTLKQKSIMPAEIETQLLDYTMLMKKQFFNVTNSDVSKMAYQLAIRNKLNNPLEHNEEDSAAWFDDFMRKHSNLIIHKPRDKSNFKTGFNKDSVSAFYKMLENVYKEHHYKANHIFSVDETAFTIPAHLKRVPQIIDIKGRKQVGSLTTAEKESLITVIFSMSAGGTFIPPMLIFPYKNMTDSLMKDAPPGSIGRCHSSGWVQTDLFIEWFEHFIKKAKPTKRSPILLILDGSYPHSRNIDVIDIARKNYVTLLSIPPHTTYKMQPLDRTFLRPFKQYYSEYICAWHRDNQRTMKQYDLVEMLGKAYLRCETRQIAANGFKVTGIYPFNRHVFSDSEFIASTPEEKNLADSTDCMSSKREMTSSITKEHQQIEDLSQPSCSKDSGAKQNEMIMPEEIWPVVQIKSIPGRKLSKLAMYTSSEYQETLKLSLKSTETKKNLKESSVLLLNKNVKKM